MLWMPRDSLGFVVALPLAPGLAGVVVLMRVSTYQNGFDIIERID
jgi:hypothetical protein